MKYVGPALFLLALILVYSIFYRPDWVWALGGLLVTAVLVAVVVVFIADLRAQKEP